MTPQAYLTDFLLQRIAEQPAREQVVLYRALAAESNDKLVRKECSEIADALEAADHKQQLLALQHKLEASK